MLSLALLALAAGTLGWPAGPGPARLAAVDLRRRAQAAGPHRPRRGRGARTQTALAVLPAALAGALLIGPGGALAAAAATGTGLARWHAGQSRRRAATAAAGLVEALGILVAELRAGAHPAAAMDTVAADAAAETSRALGSAAAAARLGADVPAVLRAQDAPAVAPWLARVAAAWALAERHGVPLADLLDAVRADAEQRVRFAAEVEARLAGPRATAAVLAGLPLLGLLLGQAVGADPWAVLAGTTVGQVLLVIGTALGCAGVVWSARIVAAAVPL